MGHLKFFPFLLNRVLLTFFLVPRKVYSFAVGGYIGGLVPKLKYDTKSQLEEQEEMTKAGAGCQQRQKRRGEKAVISSARKGKLLFIVILSFNFVRFLSFIS